MSKRKRLKTAAETLISNDRLRAQTALYFRLAVNSGYAVLQAAAGVITRSVWAGTLAFYYLTLALIRLFLLRGSKRANALQKWKKYRLGGFIMLVLNFALLGIHCVTLYMGHIIAYPGYMIYAMALYTFYAAIAAARNIAIYRKFNDPILSADKALSLAAAAISVYSLQSAMISAFGDSEPFRIVMSNCVGAGVFALICAVSLFMIVKGTRAVKRIKKP